MSGGRTQDFKWLEGHIKAASSDVANWPSWKSPGSTASSPQSSNEPSAHEVTIGWRSCHWQQAVTLAFTNIRYRERAGHLRCPLFFCEVVGRQSEGEGSQLAGLGNNGPPLIETVTQMVPSTIRLRITLR
jgi:hypothetical protein